jgi:PAS domain S-box-containing protein
MYPRFLVVDDERDMLKLMQEVLGRHFPGSTVVTADSGTTGLKKARAEKPDIVLLDAKMPGMDGFEVCRQIKRDSSPASPPVIMYTGYYGDEHHRAEGLESGADGYLCKPFEDAELVFQIRAILRMRQVEARYRAIVEDQVDLVCRCTPDGTLTFVNEAYANYFGKTKAQLQGTSFYALIPEDEHEEVRAHFTSIASAEPVKTIEHRVRNADGELRWQQWCDRGLFDGKGTCVEIQSVGRDITERKRMEDELRQAKIKAEAADHAKSALLAGMSHELRTPLNAVIGFSQVLQEGYFGDLNEKQKAYVADILTGGRQLLRLVDSVLDVANIDTSDAELKLSTLRAADVVAESLEGMRERCRKRGITLTLNVTPAAGQADVCSDERKIRQIMFVLLSNAVSFTPDNGRITVSVETNAELTVTVSDTGVGLRKEDLEKVFDDFYQVSNSRLGKTPGMGLGLSLVKRLAEDLGGRAWAESDGRGQGSRFSFSLPLVVDAVSGADSRQDSEVGDDE